MRHLSIIVSLALAFTPVAHSKRFNPWSFPQTVAKCDAVNRKEGKNVKIKIHYVDINPTASETLIMVHGWPSLWSSWSNQIEEFKSEYRIIALDHRGFGSSTHPGDVESSGTMGDIVGDLTCVLENAGVQKAICVGHDWGAQVCWEAGRQRPDVFHAIVGAVVPYIPSAGDFVPTSALVPSLPKLAYQLFFQRKTDAAIKELNKDVRRTLRATLRSVASPPPDKFLTSEDSYLAAWDGVKTIPPFPFLSAKEEDYFVERYRIQGFKYTLEFYTEGNRFGSYQFANKQGNFTIPQPSLAIYPTEDPVADWKKAAELLGADKFLPNLHVETIAAAHWPQLERPKEFNAIMRKWLATLYATSSTGAAEPETPQAPGEHDEL